jgi:hypothetical protein
MKYELLIKDILKHTKRAGLTEEAEVLEGALNIMKVSLLSINSIGSIINNKFLSFSLSLFCARLYQKLQTT